MTTGVPSRRSTSLADRAKPRSAWAVMAAPLSSCRRSAVTLGGPTDNATDVRGLWFASTRTAHLTLGGLVAVEWTLTIDCANPARLADFWSVALGYVLAPPPAGFDTWEEWFVRFGVPEDEW